MDDRPIALIGYRGSGKTTVAQQLAMQLGWDWVDADGQVERRAGKSIAAVFADDGEPAFRELECEVVADLCRRRRVIVSLGGGAVLRKENCDALQNCASVVWLQASIDSIEQRLAADPVTSARRPNLTAVGGRHEIERLLAERTPHYEACATLVVDTEGKDPTAVASEIVAALNARA
jgi:shikimate kinase